MSSSKKNITKPWSKTNFLFGIRFKIFGALLVLLLPSLLLPLYASSQMSEMLEKNDEEIQAWANTFESFETDFLKKNLRNFVDNTLNKKSNFRTSDGEFDQEAWLTEIKSDVANTTYTIKGKEDGYYFLFDYEGNCISHYFRNMIGKNFYDSKDKKGKLMNQRMIQKAKKGGGYVIYVWEHPDPNRPKVGEGPLYPKLGYALPIKVSNWDSGYWVGTGIYLPRESPMLTKKFVSDCTTSYFVFSIVLYMFIIILIYLIVRSVLSRLQKLSDASLLISNGEYGTVVSVEGRDEIADLQNSFNNMSVKLRDATDRILHEEEIISLGARASDVAHNFANDLFSIGNSLQYFKRILSKLDLNEKQSSELWVVFNEIDSSSNLSKSFLELLRGYIDRGRGDSNVPFDVKSVVHKMQKLKRRELRKRYIQLIVEDDNKVDYLVRGDQYSLLIVLNDLINNAIDALSEAKVKIINIYIRSNDSTIELECADSGTGFGNDIDLSHVFNRDYTTKSDRPHRGLGLYQNRRCIESEFGGKLIAQNNNKNGASVIIILNSFVPPGESQEDNNND